MDYYRKIRAEIFRAYNFKRPRTTNILLSDGKCVGFTPVRSIQPDNPLIEYKLVDLNMTTNLPDVIFDTLVNALRDYGKDDVFYTTKGDGNLILKANDMYIAITKEAPLVIH